MDKKISIEQHQMLEDLTGLQHTQTGKIRTKQNRTARETIRLGLRDPNQELKQILRNIIKEKGQV